MPSSTCSFPHLLSTFTIDNSIFKPSNYQRKFSSLEVFKPITFPPSIQFIMSLFYYDKSEHTKNNEANENVHNNWILNKNTETAVVILLLIIVVLKIIEFVYIVYTGHVRRLRKRYLHSTNPNNNQA